MIHIPVDHNILIDRLNNWNGLSATAPSWFYTYLTGRSYFIALADQLSDTHDIFSGGHQGSILGSLLFSLYMLPLGKLICDHGVNYNFYADDTELYLSVAADDLNALTSLTNCVSANPTPQTKPGSQISEVNNTMTPNRCLFLLCIALS